MLVSGAGITWAHLGNDIVCLAVFVFNWSRQLCQLPPDSLVIMEPHDDYRIWIFFFWVTLGITCRIKWVVAALRGLWPRGMFRLMELMFSLVGLLGFSLVSSSFGLLNFKTSPSSVFIFHPFEIYFLYFFWETSPSLVSSFSLAVTLLQWAMQRRLLFFLLEVRFSFIFLFFLLFQCRYKPW